MICAESVYMGSGWYLAKLKSWKLQGLFMSLYRFLLITFLISENFIPVQQKSDICSFACLYFKNQCRPPESEQLPEGIITNTSNLQMLPLWGFPKVKLYEMTEVSINDDWALNLVNFFLIWILKIEFIEHALSHKVWYYSGKNCTLL